MGQLSSHVILATLCLGAVSQMGAPVAAEVPEMCSGSEATIRCVERNFDVMSHSHRTRFWAILHEAARDLRERAPQGQECDSTGKMVQFLSLARVKPVSAEFVEFHSQQIERLCLDAAPCFRKASKFLDEDGRAALRSMLANPVFVDPAALESAKCIAGPHSKPKQN
jgi:hypothetical protein